MISRISLSSCAATLLAAVSVPALAATPARKPSAAPRGKAAVVKKAPVRPDAPLPGVKKLEILPEAVQLDGPTSRAHLVVGAILADGTTRDVTERVKLIPSNPTLVSVQDGVLIPRHDGDTKLVAKLGAIVSAPAPVTVRHSGTKAPVQFVNDVMPILAKSGCNSTACHGSPAGKGGLKFSLFGYEPDLDYLALTKETDAKEAHAKRIDRENPAKSLLLQKSVMELPHAGGKRFSPTSREYAVLLNWIRDGAPGIGDFEARVKKVRVLPEQPWLPAPGARQRLVVVATMSDGTTRDVTDSALYSSNDDSVAQVDAAGRMTGKRPGETAVMVRYLGQVAVSRVAVLPSWKLDGAARPAAYNRLDTLVQTKLQKLRMLPSDLCTDEEFIRRATLDTCGIIPTAEEVRTFVAECDAERKGPGAGTSQKAREHLVDRLLERPEYVDLWTMKWCDTLRDSPKTLRYSFAEYGEWIRKQIASNRPYNEWVKDLLTSSGRAVDDQKEAEIVAQAENKKAKKQAAVLANQKSKAAVATTPATPATAPEVTTPAAPEAPAPTGKAAKRAAKMAANQAAKKGGKRRRQEEAMPFNAAASYYLVAKDPLDLAAASSQVFLGVRIECARCHNHPFEKWTQNDFYGYAAHFTGVSAPKNKRGIAVQAVANPTPLRLPKTNEPVVARTLEETASPHSATGDPRVALASWMTSSENPYFARALVNRVWGHYFGRGIVEPIDDFRVTNPASNPELLDALAEEFVKSGYNVKTIHRMILTSRTYQSSSTPNRYNRDDTSNFARYYPKRMMAEELYDSISQATGVFLGGERGAARRRKGKKAIYAAAEAPTGTQRVMQLENLGGAKKAATGDTVQFLEAFGKPRRESVCECERSNDGNMAQALALLNGDEVNAKIATPGGSVQKLVASDKPEPELVEELYLDILSRRPTPAQQQRAVAVIRSAKSRGEGVEDVAWGLLNSREFLFVH